MKWFYQTDQYEVGPLTETALRELTSNGAINEQTLVRREDSTEWQQFSIAFSLLSKTERHSESAVKNQQFKFHCPHCQQKISADASQSGISAQCPTCGDDFVVPQVTEVIDPPEPGNDVSDEARSTEVPAPQQASVVSSTLDTRMSNSFSERVKDGSLAMKKGAEIVKEGSKVGWSGVKRRSKQAALRAQIQKLRQIDLRKALHALGKEAFEQGVLATELAAQFHTIRELDSKISEMREKAVAGSGESKMEALKRVSKYAANASQAQALTVKREHLIIELGSLIYSRKTEPSPETLNDNLTKIAAIEERINRMGEEIRTLGDDVKGRMPTLIAATLLVLLIVGGSFAGLRGITAWRDHKYESSDAVEILRKGAEKGHPQAQYLLGDCYFNGDRVDLDRTEAVKWYRKSAEQGNAAAQSMLGLSLQHGQGVEQDRGEAVKWYRKAAEQGDASAQCILATHYSMGEVVAKNEVEAVKWYRRSAEQGDAAAQCMLGNYYVLGGDLEQDYAEAYKWYLLAASQGHEDANKLVEVIEKKKLSPEQRAKGQRLAKEWTAKHEEE